ncbi:PRC-barrel domain-containing protein [Wukongibacter baidiensis]|uniref:PRC-barrel domain-containing protein n=1 Tax=Wukongibacter baidiensis TaxID=1723361 RepID=UPI003D7F481E
MLKVSDIIGYQIMCADNMKFKGEVKDVVLDFSDCKLAGIIIDYGSILHHSRVINFNSIYEIDRNKVVVRFKKNIQQMKTIDFNNNYVKKNEKILGVEVVGEEENLLGFIQDVIFEEKSGNILGLILTNGIYDDVFNGVEILPINGPVRFDKNRIAISKKTKKNILRNVGGLKKLLELEH